MLTFFQKKLAGSAIACVSIAIIFAFCVGLLVLFSKFLVAFGIVVWPLAVAAIAAIILYPSVNFLISKCRMKPLWATISVFAAIIFVLSLVAILLLPNLANEISSIASEIPDILKRFGAFLTEKFPNLKGIISQKLAEIENADVSKATLISASEWLKNLSKGTLTATSGAMALFSFCAAFAVAPIYLFYMLTLETDLRAKIENNISFLPINTRTDLIFFGKRFAEIMTTFFRGQLLIAIIMGVLLGSGLWIAGVKFGFLLGFLAGILNIIPYFGTIVGLGTILPTAFFQTGGSLTLSSIALGVFILVQLIEAYLLTPKIMGNRTGLHPMVIIFSVFFWGIALDGILGMILAVPLTAFIVAAWCRIRARIGEYISERKTVETNAEKSR